jgi:hypothetical protein
MKVAELFEAEKTSKPKLNAYEKERLVLDILEAFAKRFKLDIVDLLNNEFGEYDEDLYGAIYLMRKGEHPANMSDAPVVTWSKRYRPASVRLITGDNHDEKEIKLKDLAAVKSIDSDS